MIHNFAEIAHRTQVVLIVQDADSPAISSQDLDLGITVEWICCAGGDASLELDFTIHGDAYLGLFLSDDDNLHLSITCCR